MCLSAALGFHCAHRSSVIAFYIYPQLFATTNFQLRGFTGTLEVQSKLCAETDISHCPHAASPTVTQLRSLVCPKYYLVPQKNLYPDPIFTFSVIQTERKVAPRFTQPCRLC